jgi:ureidoacrylate peracid hydrolase
VTHPRLSDSFKSRLRERRRGRLHVFGELETPRAALIVMDMQNVFVDPESPLAVESARSVVPAINELSKAMRDAGCPVIWVRSTFGARGRSSWPLYFDYFAPGADGASLRECFFPGSRWHEFWPGLDRHGSDIVVDKDRFSAFIEGASDLEQRLIELRRDTLVIAGTLTNVCCESTMRDAMMRDFRCVLVEDACAAQTDAEHLASLENAARVFGDVMTVAEALASLRH